MRCFPTPDLFINVLCRKHYEPDQLFMIDRIFLLKAMALSNYRSIYIK